MRDTVCVTNYLITDTRKEQMQVILLHLLSRHYRQRASHSGSVQIILENKYSCGSIIDLKKVLLACKKSGGSIIDHMQKFRQQAGHSRQQTDHLRRIGSIIDNEQVILADALLTTRRSF